MPKKKVPKSPPAGAAVPGYADASTTPPGAYFIAVEGKRSSATGGYWVIPSEQHYAHGVSGNSSKFKAPAGTWYSTSGYLTTTEDGMVTKTAEGKINHKVQFGVLKKGAVAPPWGPVDTKLLTRDFWDKDAGKEGAMRDGIAAHVDGMAGKGCEGGAGTAGCFGVRDSPAIANAKGSVSAAPTGTTDPGMLVRHQAAMKKVFAKPGVPMQVEYYKTQSEVEARVAQLTKDYDFWNRPIFLSQPPVTAPPSLAGTFDLQLGRTDVLVGQDGNPLAFAAPMCTHAGGGSVADGSHSVRVGAELFPVGRETDPTTDGLELASDVDFLRIGD